MKKGLNAQEVLRTVEVKIGEIEGVKELGFRSAYHTRLKIKNVCSELSIFDWWNDYLSLAQLKDMKKFLKEAIKLGYTGYVCFKVGATGCANGMWAHKEESETGYSPDGECLYKSFTPAYNYWRVKTADGRFIPEGNDYDSIKTIRQLENMLNK